MDGNPNSNLNQQQYMMNFGASAHHQQAPRLQEQDYAQLFFNQQNYINNLNVHGIYNSTQQQTVDVQSLQRQRQQQILQALNNPQQQIPQLHSVQQQGQSVDQNLSQSMSQQLQQQLYASSMQFQQQLQNQQQQTPQLSAQQLEHLTSLQNGGNLLHSNHQQFQHQAQQQQFFTPKNSVGVDYNNTSVNLSSTSHQPSTSSGVQQHQQQVQASQLSAMVAAQQQQQQQQQQHQLLHQQQLQHQNQQQQQTVQKTHTEEVLQQPNQVKVPSSATTKRTLAEPMVQSPYALPTSLRRSKDEKALTFNTNIKNAKLLKEREEEELTEKKLQEDRDKKRIQDELKQKKEDAKEFADSLNERIKSFPEPFHLATCHTLSKVSSFLPFPSECNSTSSSLPCFDVQRAASVLANTDMNLAHYLSEILADTTDDIREIDLKHDEEEVNEMEPDLLTPLVQSVLNFNALAFNVEPSEFGLSEMEQAFGKDIQEAVIQVTMDADAAAIAAATASVFNQQPSTSGDQTDIHQNIINSTTTSYNDGTEHMETKNTPMPQLIATSQEQIQLRRQMVSVGKQPKAVPGRKKRDMVESLYDSLTGYFDPSKDSRRRGCRTRNSEEKDFDEKDEKSLEDIAGTSENSADLLATPKERSEDIIVGKFFEKRSIRKKTQQNEREDNRPATPTEIIQQREMEWLARQQQRQEKYRRRQNEEAECWNNDTLAENESFCKFTNLIDHILDQIEDFDIVQNDAEVEIAQELLIDRNQLEELRTEAQKLKSWRKINKVNNDRLVKLLTVLEKNIRDVLNEDGSLLIPVGADAEDESDEAYREIMDERLMRSVDASCVALTIMTSSKMPKQVLIEDSIERSIQLCKQYLQHIIYPVTDISFKSPIKVKKSADGVKRRRILEPFTPLKMTLYARVVDLISCFAELARFQPLNDSIMVQLCSLATPSFFVENVPEVQIESIKLLSTIFSKCSFLRQTIFIDLLNSLYRLPTSRSQKNCYNLGNGQFISNFTALILQLIQSSVKLPQQKTKGVGDETDESQTDSEAKDCLVLEAYDEARRRIGFFLERFLAKCTAKSEDDYRRLFEHFLSDVLLVLYRPEWPVAELVLTVLANLLVMYFRSKNLTTMLSLRVASLEYLGTITARLRKDRVQAENLAQSTFEQNRLDLVVRGIVYDELNEMSKTIDEIDISHLSSNEKLRKLEQALIDYIIYSKGDSEVSVEYVVTFYAAEWFRGTVLDVKSIKEKYQESDRQKSKQDRKLERIIEKGANMKEFILLLLNKKNLKKRAHYVSRTGNVMVDSDAQWVVKYLASKKEDLSQSFDVYLKHILEGFHPDLPVAVRAKAMKCLTQIVEVDPHVLVNPDVDTIVRDRLVDANAAVREAAFELIGKYLVLKPELLNSFYSLLLNRIKDTAVAVRKRVIRILKDIVDKQPNLDKKPEILSRIVQRINDEEGVRKLCLETFQALWFCPNRDHEKRELIDKVILMADVVDACVRDNIIEHFETLISSIVKKSTDYETLLASKQIVDALVDYIISLDSKIANDEQKIEDIEKLEQNQLEIEKTNQARLLASLTTLSVFSKTRPDLLVRHADVFLPYLSMQVSSNVELRVLNQMILMLEQLVPLIEHPSNTFLRALDNRLNDIVRDGGMVIISSAIACMSAAYEKFQKVFPGICGLFLVYLKYLSKLKQDMEENTAHELQPDKKPTIMRSLYTLGLSGRYFDFDALLTNQPEYAQSIAMFAALQKKVQPAATTPASEASAGAGDTAEEKDEVSHVLRDQVFLVLLYFSRSRDGGICEKALIALGQLTAGCSELLMRSEIKNMYLVLLNTDRCEYMKLKIQVLRNLSYFLNAEEVRALKKNEQYIKERAEQKDDLKEMELSSSGLSSSVIQVYWNAILNCYFHTDETVRTESAQVIWQTLEQGLVTPGSSIPTLIAMSTDPIQNVRVKIANLIKDIDTKYAGMVASKAIPGVRMAFRLHKKISIDQMTKLQKQQQSAAAREIASSIRGVRATTDTLTDLTLSNDVQSLLMGLYVGIRTNRQQRRSFLSAILRLFSENVKESPELNELSFVADNLAHFPYQVMDEPLYVIYQTDSIISISGQNILSSFKAVLTPLQKTLVQQQDFQQQNFDQSSNLHQQLPAIASHSSISIEDDDEDFSEESILNRFPEDIVKVQELREQSLPCFFLLHLKFYLMRMYGFSKDRIQEYSPSEAAKVYEKPMNRRNIAVFSPEALMRHLDGVKDEFETQDSFKLRKKLAEHFCSLFQMLLSLDKGEDDDENGASNEITVSTNAELITADDDDVDNEEEKRRRGGGNTDGDSNLAEKG